MDLGATLGYSMSPDADEQLLSISFHPGVLMKRNLSEWYAEASDGTTTNFRTRLQIFGFIFLFV